MNTTARPKVVFAIGDADWKYTRGKFQTLVRRVAATEQFDVSVVSHDEEICGNFQAQGIANYCLRGEHLPLAAEHSVAMTELMIRHTQDVSFPASRLHVWKVMAMDDYLGCVDVIERPELPLHPDLLVYPLMGVDNNSTAAARLYSSMLLQAHKTAAKVVGLEVSLLGNKQTLGASLADSYALKSDFSRAFVLREELALPHCSFVLPSDETYLLTCRNDTYLDDYFAQEDSIRRKFNLPQGNVVIMIPHHVAFIHEIRRLLLELKALPFPFSVILRADPNIARQGLKERDIASRVYRDEIAALPQVIVDDQGGWLWPLLLADAVLAPAHSVFTELASSYGKFTAVCQAWGDSAWISDRLFVEPRADKAIAALRSWVEKNVLTRSCLSDILIGALAQKMNPEQFGVANEL
jgi:hypothetical protein